MRGNNVVGVLFSNVHDDKIRELTERRTIASVPFGGRYRLIDFCARLIAQIIPLMEAKLILLSKPTPKIVLPLGHSN